MKLWVDDIREAPDESWTVARKVQPALNILSQFTYEWDEISLDHDIENRPDDETFMPVAYYMAMLYGNMPRNVKVPKITIHSINPVGARNMHDTLKRYGVESLIEPYTPDMKHLREKYGEDIK